MVSVNTDNVASCNLTIFAETTAELRVGKKRFRDYKLNHHCLQQVQVGAWASVGACELTHHFGSI